MMAKASLARCIDIHSHFLPAEFVRRARRAQVPGGVRIERGGGQEWVVHPQGYRYPLLPEMWDVAARLRQMDQLGIDVSILSINAPLFYYWLDPEATRAFCRWINDALAQSGGRLYGLATVPLQDPKAAAAELRRAVRECGLLGAQIGTRVEGRYLDDPALDPFFVAAAELGVPLLLHPYYDSAEDGLSSYHLRNLVGHPFATTVAAARLILSGFRQRHPEAKLVFVHGGGFLPYQIGRLDHAYYVRADTAARSHESPGARLRQFYFDTITHSAASLKMLLALVGPERLVLGTDLPFDMAERQFEAQFAAAGLDEMAARQIRATNATRLFGLAGEDGATIQTARNSERAA